MATQDREGLSKLGVRVPLDVHRALRLAAVEDARRQDEIVTEALQQWLQRRHRRLRRVEA
jgi:hypothetical protein